jgi:hypothetical protein
VRFSARADAIIADSAPGWASRGECYRSCILVAACRLATEWAWWLQLAADRVTSRIYDVKTLTELDISHNR